MTIALVYDPRYHTFESWASLMCEAYAGQQLQIPGPDVDFKSWGAGLKAIDIFANEGIGYRVWWSWSVFWVDTMYVGFAVIATLGFLLTYCVDYLERRALPWQGK